MPKIWVFEELVDGEQDLQGLMAYALYKHKKHTLAVSLRNSGVDEEVISDRLNNFHDDQVASQQIEDYRERSSTMLDNLFVKIEEDVKDQLDKQHKKEIERLEKERVKALKTSEDRLVRNIIRYKADKRSFWMKTWLWLASGVPAALSAVVVSAIFYAMLFFLVPDDLKKDVYKGAFQTITGTVLNDADIRK